MARWEKGQSGNALGRPRRKDTIADIIRQRLDKRELVDRLIAMATGKVPDCPHLCELGAARLLLMYHDGLPPRSEENEQQRIAVSVNYVDVLPHWQRSDVVDVVPAQLDAAE